MIFVEQDIKYVWRDCSFFLQYKKKLFITIWYINICHASLECCPNINSETYYMCVLRTTLCRMVLIPLPGTSDNHQINETFESKSNGVRSVLPALYWLSYCAICVGLSRVIFFFKLFFNGRYTYVQKVKQ